MPIAFRFVAILALSVAAALPVDVLAQYKADMVKSYTYDLCAATNRKYCAKPKTYTDERGKVTKYQYSSIHGGITDIQFPLVPGEGYRKTKKISCLVSSEGATCSDSGPDVKVTEYHYEQGNASRLHISLEETNLKDKEIQRLIAAEELQEALRLCEERLTESGSESSDILRQRSHIHALAGDYENALLDRVAIIDDGKARLQDFFQAANAALYLQHFGKAETYLAQLLEMGKASDEDWFASAAHFLTAYAQMMANKIDQASVSLSCAAAIDPNCEMPIPRSGIWDIRKLQAEIDMASRRR